MKIFNLIITILSGLIVCIPLVIELVKVSKEAVRKGNWNKIVKMVATLMVQAEKNFDVGATKKEWVLSMIRVSAKEIDYDLTEAEIIKISDMIDQLCAMAKDVNVVYKEEVK